MYTGSIQENSYQLENEAHNTKKLENIYTCKLDKVTLHENIVYFKLCCIGPTLFVCLNISLCINFYLYVPFSPFKGAFLCILYVY
jgi:hypothetical protein